MPQNYLDYLTQIYKKASPTASDEEIQAKVNQTDPNAAQAALSPYMKDPYDVTISNDTVKMNGRPESLPSQVGDEPIPLDLESANVAPTAPIVPEPVTPPIMPPKQQIEAPKKAQISTKAPSEGSNPLEALLQASSTDQEARNRMLKDEKAKHLMGMIPIALGGIGDAVGNAAAAYGGKGASGTAERIAAGLEKGETGRKAQFEENLKNDPNSQISGHYRNVLAMMMGKKADDPQIKNLSAAQIATTLPEVEKYMGKQMALKALAQRSEAKTETPSVKPTTAQAAVDREFAKDYAKYTTSGGSADVMNQIGSLEAVQLKLEQGKQLTGPILSAMPDAIRKRTNPESIAVQQEVEQSIQRTLKQTLGGQFTEREGTLFMQRGYDPALPEAENAKKLKRAINQLKMMAVAKQQAADYYEENGTLTGFKGQLYTVKDGAVTETSKDDFYKMMTPQTGAASATPSSSLAANEEIRVAKDGRKIVYDKSTKKPLRIYGE